MGSYYLHGLKLANHAELTNRAREILLSGEFPEITGERFEQRIGKISGIDNQKTYVVLDDVELINYCGHYLIYGSEHICGIAASLITPGGRDYRQVLKRCGIPTVLTIALPINRIPPDQLNDLASELCWHFKEEEIGDEPHPFSWSFILGTCVPPEAIIGHAHPELIPDPLLRDLPYRYRDDGTPHDLAPYLTHVANYQ